jgi:hypothetical protein
MSHDRNPMLVVMSDKFLVREHARSCSVATAPLFHVAEKAEGIPFKALPPDCMVKASHGSGWNLLRRKGEFYSFGNGAMFAPLEDKSSRAPQPGRLDEDEVNAVCRHWLETNYCGQQWAYSRMTPRILVEGLLAPRGGGELMDYRFYTFDGVVKAINVGSPSYRRDNLNAFFSPDWTPMKLTRYREKLPQLLPEKPERLPEMLEAAKRLGDGIDFARIDIYDTTIGVVLGEMTAYPEGGNREAPSGCPRLNWWLGRQWNMPFRKELSVRHHMVETLFGSVMRRCKRVPNSLS